MNDDKTCYNGSDDDKAHNKARTIMMKPIRGNNEKEPSNVMSLPPLLHHHQHRDYNHNGLARTIMESVKVFRLL
jgi:hypothetical protein